MGSPVDESYIYKIKRAPKSLADRSYDVLSVLDRINKKHSRVNRVSNHPSTPSKQASDSTKVFSLKTINGEDITNVDLINTIKLIFFFSGKSYDKKIAKMIAQNLLDSLVDDRLRQQCARFLRVKISAGDIDAKVKEMADSNGMTVDQLSKQFEQSNISMDIFRDYIRSKLIFQVVAEAFSEGERVSDQEVKEAQENEKDLISSTRYRVSEIFRFDEKSAQEVLKLIKEGFSFQMLSENFSQSVGPDYNRWTKESALEPEVRKALKSLNPGEVTSVIKTKTGYKIVCLLDKAQPNRVGMSETTYKVLRASMVCSSPLFTQKDIQAIEQRAEKLMQANSPTEFKKLCEQYKVSVIEDELTHPDPYNMELIRRFKESKKPALLQDMDDESKLNFLVLLEENTPKATLPPDKEIRKTLMESHATDKFLRNFKKLKGTAHITEKSENLAKAFL